MLLPDVPIGYRAARWCAHGHRAGVRGGVPRLHAAVLGRGGPVRSRQTRLPCSHADIQGVELLCFFGVSASYLFLSL